MKNTEKHDSRVSRVSKDVLDPKPCKNDHTNQFTEMDRDGIVWQYCFGCDRKLFVR